MNFISFYLLLGIGCDDIFIYTDAFKQSPAEWPFEKRLGWAFRRASYTMATTTTTTGFAFFLLALSEIPIIKYFGIYTAMLLFVNFGMVCTVYTSALVIWHDHFGGGKRWLPTFERCCNSRKDENDLDQENQDEDLDSPDYNIDSSLSGLEQFFKLVYARRFINKRICRLSILALAAMLAVTSIGLSFNLELSKELLSFWDKTHYFGIYLIARRDAFQQSSRILRVKKVYGVESPFIDRTGTKETVNGDFGSPIYNMDFDLAEPEAQTFLRDSCIETANTNANFLKLSQNLTKEETSECVMLAFALWREARNESFPVMKSSIGSSATEDSSSGNIIDGIKVPSIFLNESFNDLMLEFLGRPHFRSFNKNVGFRRTNHGLLSPKFLTHDYATQIKVDDSLSYRTQVKKAWDAHIAEENARTPVSLGEAYYTDSPLWYFVWQRTMTLFRSGALMSIGLSLILAFVLTTIATKNWILAILCCLTMLLVVLNVSAVIYLSGFDIGAIESTLLILVIGVSIDYQLHIIIGYSDGQFEGKIKDREGRCEHALGTLGSSVLAGSMTTIISTSTLLFATIVFFSRFAIIMVTAASIAVIYGIVVLPSLLSTFGPQNEQGNIFLVSSKKENGDGKSDRPFTQSSMVIRSNRTVRYGLFVYIVFLVFIGSIMVATYNIRSKQMKESKKESEEDLNRSFLNESLPSMPDFKDLVIGEWNELYPGNDTMCARGTPYAFYVRKGEKDAPMIVELQGGGACWNPSTCRKVTGTFSDTIEPTRATFRRIKNGDERPTGMFDEEGPYKNFTYVYLPYCTGDLHWGNATVRYSDTLTIRHMGWVNANAVLNYVLSQIPPPPRLLVTGCSAGAYGSWLWAQWISKKYTDNGIMDTKIYQMGDSGMGVVTDSFLNESFLNWNFFGGGFPQFIIPTAKISKLENKNLVGVTLSNLYEWGAIHFSNSTFGQASSAYDWNQAFFFKTMKEETGTKIISEYKIIWNVKMNSIYDISKLTRPRNLVHWVASGDYHCMIGPRHYFADFSGEPYFKRLYNYFMNDIINDIDCRNVSIKYCQQGVDLRENITLF